MLTDEELQSLHDRMAIQDVLVTYCRGIDRCDINLLKSVYWPDATDDHGSFNGNAHEFCDHVIPALKTMHRTMHSITNMYVELEGHRAKAETYCVAYHSLDGEGGLQDMIVAGRYLDVLEKRMLKWKIAKRVYVMDWNQNQPSTAEWEAGLFGQLKTRGARFPEDPWYQFG